MKKELIKKLKMYLSDREVATFIEQAETNSKLTEIAEALVSAMQKQQLGPGPSRNNFDIIERYKGEQGDEGPQGEPGYTPIAGKDFYTEEEKEAFKLELIKLVTPEKGVDYFTNDDIEQFLELTTPKKGKDYFTETEVKEFKEEITPVKGRDYFDGEPGKDGSPDKPKDIVEKLNTTEGEIKLKVLQGLDDRIRSLIPKNLNKSVKLYRGGSGGSGSGGASAFTDLTDVPQDYTSAAQKFVKVNAAGDGLEFVAGSGAAVAWGDLTGTLSDQTDLQDALDGKADALTADQNYVTDAQLVVIGNTSGTNTGDQTSVSGNAGTATALQTARTIGGVSFDGTANITVASATGGFTVSGGALALGTQNLTMTGSLAATGARVTKGWFTDIESTNMPTVGGVAVLSSLTAPQFTTIELGHASDTTISRVSAGKIAVEGVNVGFLEIPQNSQSAAYTTVLADSGKHILHPAADNNARTFTIDSNANVAYPIGTTLTFINEINTVTIAITSDTLVLAGAGTTGSRTLAANGMATAVKITSTKWIINGTGLT